MTDGLVGTRPGHCVDDGRHSDDIPEGSSNRKCFGTAHFTNVICIIADIKFACPNVVTILNHPVIVRHKKGIVSRASQDGGKES